ncbi:MAG: signal peptidase II [Coriobacteriaceae bacterium]|nr:signal peptidase II [Coriobacteriaceae bacterium]
MREADTARASEGDAHGRALRDVQGMGRVAVAGGRPGWLFLAVAVSALLLDQVSKAVVRASLVPMDSKPLIPGVLYLTHVRNPGAAFGMIPGGRWLFVATSLAVLAGIAVYWFRSEPDRFTGLALGLVTGGAVGNLYDRLAVGRVTDFFDVRVFPVFNIADAAIFIGVVLLLWRLLFARVDEEGTGDRAVAVETPDPDGVGGDGA